MNTELLPCAHCGSQAKYGECSDTENFGGQFIECTNLQCGMSTCIMFPAMCSVSEELAERWNARTALQSDGGLKNFKCASCGTLDYNQPDKDTIECAYCGKEYGSLDLKGWGGESCEASGSHDGGAKGRTEATFNYLCNVVCKDLPAGFWIELNLEQGSGEVVLWTDGGDATRFHPDKDTSMQRCIEMAMEAASSNGKEGE